jgi:anti-sigma factor RsiW
MNVSKLLRRDYRCQDLVEVVSDYLEGVLPPRDRSRLEAHLRACDGCEQYVAQLRRTVQLTGRLGVDDVDALGVEARDRLLEAFRRYHAAR